MHRYVRSLRVFAAFAAVALLFTACGDEDPAAAPDDVERGTVTIGSADFDENELVASMYAAVLEDAGYDVERRFLFGTRETYFAALEDGDLDLVPEYIGTLLEFLTGGAGVATGDTQETLDLLRDEVADVGVAVLEPSDAENKNGFVVTRETADEHGLEAVSDLQAVAGELVLGGPPECPERPLCLLGLEDVYDVHFGDFQPLDAGGPVTVAALEGGDIDVALLFTTDESIGINDWVLLDDDRELQPVENVTPVIREDALHDEIADLLDAVSAELTTDGLTELNRQVRFEGLDPQDVAEDWLTDRGLL